ncbi:hypothetical protein [Taklimakanibacter deserti]|uniref:hypothetical protein n=1 Tax=Taklimakanibacter deserti TaxID=2267839 RepID=UPI0013C460B4
MSGSFDSNELAVLQRIVDLAAADLGVNDEKAKYLIAARVLAVAQFGNWDFELFMAHAKGTFRASRGGGASGL